MPGNSPPTVEEVCDRIRPIAEADTRVRFVYLFGSTARGEADAASDIDLAVYMTPRGTLLDEAQLSQQAEAALGRADVDVTILNDAPLWLQFRSPQLRQR